MNKNKEVLPVNWLKRFSRRRRRGREYYYNVTTKEKSWNHPLENVTEENVVQWLNRNTSESTDDNLLTRVDSSPFQSECDIERYNCLTPIFSPQLEEEYKKFEEALAIIEKNAAIDSMNCPTSPSYDDNKSSSSDAYSYTQSIPSSTIAYEHKIEQVFLRRRQNEAQMNRCLYYLVIDTSIFLNEMTFLVNFVNKIDDVPGKPMLVIPYVVLRELDQLKLRTGVISILAMQAITFISQQFKKRPNQICSQSVMDDTIHFIQILNADDCVVNCCLQLKQICQHILLLTNDTSLSNKAIRSQIATYTQSEFEAILFRFS